MSIIIELVTQALRAADISDDEKCLRMLVCDEAIRWLNTPYHPHGRIRGAGVDCAMLPLEIFSELGIVPPHDPGYYAPDWHLHRSEEKYLNYMEQYATRTNRDQYTALPGDLALFKYGRTVSHSAIVMHAPFVIHAYMQHGVIYEDMTNGNLTDKPDRFVGVWSAFKGDK